MDQIRLGGAMMRTMSTADKQLHRPVVPGSSA